MAKKKKIIEPVIRVDSDTLHIAIATYPKNQMDDYVTSIKDYYTRAKQNIESHLNKHRDSGIKDDYYNPIVYHLLGGYDVCFVTLVDSQKFPQNLFYPKNQSFNPNSFVIQTGICYNLDSSNKLHRTYTENKAKKFIAVMNLKLNNSLLIGNGKTFIDESIKAIARLLQVNNKELCDFIIVQSFSWFEINLILFGDDPEEIGQLIHKVRNLSVNQLGNSQTIKQNSLINKWVDKNDKWKNEFIIVDSHSFFGVKYNMLENDNFNIKLNTELEWQVKPGHLTNLLNELKKIQKKGPTGKKLVPVFDIKRAILLTGKSDFIIKELEPTDFTNNVALFKALKGNKDILKSAKGLRTRINFDIKEPIKNAFIPNDILFNKIGGFAFTKNELDRIDADLKTLKISRQIRLKTIKIFHNFCNGIKDTVLFICFLDFRFFLDRLLEYIKEKINKKDVKTSVEDIESHLQNYINVFQEAYHNRILNSYVFEEIYEFDLDYNSSILQLLSTFNAIAFQIAKFYSSQVNYAQLVMLNLKDTASNTLSINYSVSHLTFPEFIFFTIDKEITNSYAKQDPFCKELLRRMNFLIREKKNSNNTLNNELNILLDTKKIVLEYCLIDTFRFVTVCNYDIKLYEYWFWSFNLQNPSLYDTQGNFNEFHFHKELLRLLFILRIFNEEHFHNIQCPLPELMSLWKRYIKFSKEIIEYMVTIENERNECICHTVRELLEKHHRRCKVKENREIEFIHSYDASLRGDSIDQTIIFALVALSYKYPFNGLQKNSFDIIYGEFVKELSFPKYEYLDFGWDTNFSVSYIYSLMYCYLKRLYDQANKGKTYSKNFMANSFLNRNWKDGNVMKNFSNKGSDSSAYYLVDPLGGVFFNDEIKAKEYYELRNLIINLLWSYSMVTKKQLIYNFLERV